jgi:AsmA-like C-terminal region
MGRKPEKRRRRWLRLLLMLAVLFAAADESFTLFLERSARLNRRLTAHFEAAFGRPVEVGRYDFSLFPMPQLVAESVTVGEDQRFGNEYFLRADGLSASLRWPALLRGKLEFGTLSLLRPSLNLVRDPEYGWNLEEWMPRVPVGPASPNQVSFPAPRLRRITIDGGRINFKRSAEKLPFALVDVRGLVEQETEGRWRLDLEATPRRAAVDLQDAGTLRLRGVVGGTTFRLRPAALEFSWQDASLPDLLRLARGRDYGLRGACSLLLTARSEGPEWSLTAAAQLRGLHRWDLPLRADNPALNLHSSAVWRPEASRIESLQAVLEAPRSNLRATGSLDWSRPGPARGTVKGTHLQILSAAIRLDDLLSWFRAFHPGVAQELAASGMVGLDATFSGWPPLIESGVVTADGARLEGASLSGPIHLNAAVAHFVRDHFTLNPAAISIGRQTDVLLLDTSASRTSHDRWAWDTRTTGQFAELGDLFGLASALGWQLPPGWTIRGPAQFDLRWLNAAAPFGGEPAGKLELTGVAFRAPFLNRPIVQMKARADLGPGEQRVRLDSAQAFGARWSGTLERRAGRPWEFSLTADRLAASDLDLWMNPQWREGLLQRVLPMLTSAPAPARLPAGLEARGQLRVDDFSLPPLDLHHFHADASLQDQTLALVNAHAAWNGGTAQGSVTADFSAGPAYRIDAKFEQVNLADLVRGAGAFQNRFSGIASGELALEARGVGRQALAASLTGRGSLQVRDATLRGFDLAASLRNAARRPGDSAFQQASGSFSIAGGKVQIVRMRLQNSGDEIEASGDVAFARTLDLRVRFFPPPKADSSFRLTGSLDAPLITRIANRSRAR